MEIKFDKMTKIMHVDGVRFEDLPPLERNRVLGLLFKGGQERAALEAKNDTLENENKTMKADLEYEKTNSALVITVLVLIVLVNIATGYFLWASL